jgi:hypothetical protein
LKFFDISKEDAEMEMKDLWYLCDQKDEVIEMDKFCRKAYLEKNFNIVFKSDVEIFGKLVKMDKDKIRKYDKLNPKENPQIHEIDHDFLITFRKYFIKKYDKLIHKIEILCKFPELLVKDWMIYHRHHYFPTWVEKIMNRKRNKFTNFQLEVYRIIYHTTYISSQLEISLGSKKKIQEDFVTL